MPVGTGIGQRLSSRAIIGSFYNTLATAQPPGWVGRIAQRIDSDQGSEDLRWLGMSPAMQEWVGGRDAKGFLVNAIVIANKVFEASLGIDIDDLRRDKTGQLMVRVNELAVRAQQHRAKLLSTLIDAGATGLAYDGKAFFATNHGEGSSGTLSNLLTYDISDNTASSADGGTSTAPSAYTMQKAILQAVQQMMTFKDDQGEPMNEDARSFLVMVPPTFMAPTMAALSNPLLGGGDTNTIVNQSDFQLEMAVNQRLTWNNKFAIFRSDAQTKPLIEQIEFDPMIDAIAEGSEMEIKERKHLYTVTRSGNVAYGYWQQACQVALQA